MTSEIIRIEPVDHVFSVTWMLGAFCNYDCMYCPSELHDDKSRPWDLDVMKSGWKRIYQRSRHLMMPYKISFTGGEVTANKNFLPFVSWLRYPENQFDIKTIVVTSNGSASERYYLDLAKSVDALSFSTHSEFMDEQQFFKKCLTLNKVMIRPKKSFVVNIMDEPWNQERISIYKRFLDQHQIHYSHNRIDFSLKTRDYPIMKGKMNLGTHFKG